jgi:hypothetical protein
MLPLTCPELIRNGARVSPQGLLLVIPNTHHPSPITTVDDALRKGEETT